MQAQAAATVTSLQRDFKPLTFSVNEIYFVSRDGKNDVIGRSFPLPIKIKDSSINNNNNDNNVTTPSSLSSPSSSSTSPPKGELNTQESENGMKKGDETLPCFKFSGKEWLPAAGVSISRTSQLLVVATLNVLFDLHDADKIHTEMRTPATFSLLRGLQADVIGLQEVTKKFLDQLLEEEWIKNEYFVSSLDVGYYGQVILSRFPFKSCVINLGKKVAKKLSHTTKKAVIAELVLNGRVTHVAAIHLTSDHLENASDKRELQLDQVDSWMSLRGSENFIIGDFNFGDEGKNVLPSNYADIWCTLRPNEPGFTFNVDTNTLAQITTSKHINARFDRILCGSSLWTPKTISLFGLEPISTFILHLISFRIGKADGLDIFASDHFGVIANFEVASRCDLPKVEFSAKTLADPLYQFLQARGGLPDTSCFESCKRVVLFLKEVMEDVFGTEDWKMHLIGSSRFGVDVEGSDLDLVVIGNVARAQFFEHSVKVLSSQGDVADLRAITETTVPVIKLSLGGIKIDIQYCCIPYSVKLPSSLSDIEETVLFRLDKASMHAINGVIDSELIEKAVPDMDTFRLLVLFVKMWAKNRHIYSGSFGFLSGYPLVILAARVFNLNPSLSPYQLVSEFFGEYSAWDMRTTPMSLPGVTTPPLDHKKHAIPIFTPSKPVKIASRNGTHTTQVIVSREFERAKKILKKEGCAIGSALWKELAAPEELTNFGAYLIIIASSTSESDFMQWLGFVESRMVDIILQLQRVLDTLSPPPSIRPGDRKYATAKNGTHQARYLIGFDVPRAKCAELAKHLGSNLDFSAFSRNSAQGLLASVDISSDVTNVIREAVAFEEEKSKKRLDGASVGVTLLPFHSVRALGRLSPALVEAPVQAMSDQVAEAVVVGGNNYAEAAKQKYEKQKKSDDEFSEKKLRMRTSIEVFNRIRWDQSLPKSEFIIGYDDRFKGLMEVPYDEFDQEVPLHRIRIFKRNGIVVWSRNDRVDSVFKYNS